MELIILVVTVNHTGESTIEYSRICTIVFLQLVLKFTSDRSDFLVEIYIYIYIYKYIYGDIDI